MVEGVNSFIGKEEEEGGEGGVQGANRLAGELLLHA